MRDPRLDFEREVPSGRGPGRRRRAWVGLALVLVACVAGVAAYAGGAALVNHVNESQPSPASSSVLESPTAPGLADASASPSVAAPGSSIPGTPATGLIAVVDDSGALVTVDGRGGSRVSYPAPGVVLGFPAWSPDGSQIAAVGQGPSDSGIYVFTVNRSGGAGAEPTVVYHSPDRPPFYVYWTPDGRHVSFLTSEAAGLALRVAPVGSSTPPSGTDASSVIRRGSPLYFQWVDTNRVLLHVGDGSDAFVGQVGLDGATVGSPVVATGIFQLASLSHDGRYLAYAKSGTGTLGDIVAAAADGSTSRQLPAYGPAAMLFDPAGDTLATIAVATSAAQVLPIPSGPLRLLDPASGAVRTVLDGSVISFFWAPDGRTIAAIHLLAPGQRPSGVLGRSVLTGAGVTNPGPGTIPAAPGASVGLSFVDVSTGTIRSDRVVSLSDPFVGQLMPYFNQYALSHSVWSPDSKSIVLPLVDPSGRDQLDVIRTDASDQVSVADGSMGSWSP